MKAKHFLLAGLSVMMLGACSNNDDLTNKPGDKPTIEGEGIMNLNLQFAGGSFSKAEYDEGEGKESEIKDAYVYYFAETDNKFLGSSIATIIPPQVGSTNPGSNVENTVKATVPANVVRSLVENENAKANIIVVLNKHTSLATEGFDNFDKFNAALSGIGDDAGFMMSSSAYDNSGIKYFVEISHENIAEVGSGTKPKAVDVYVERLCSKVTLSAETAEKNPNAKIDLKNWGLNVKNTKEYPVKVLNTEFTSIQTSVWPGADDWNASADHRSYWAIDPNYASGTNSYSGDFTIINFADLKTEKGKSLYCLENTFNHESQNRNQTTTAVIYAQYTPKLEGETTTVPTVHKTWIAMNNLFYSLETFVGNFLAKQNIYKKGSGDDYVSPAGGDVTFTYTPVKVGENSQTIGGKDYKLAVKDIEIYKFTGTDPSAATPDDFTKYGDTDWTNLNTEFTKYCQTAKIYIDGYCYYEIPIRHFSDTEVPLAGTGTALPESVINDASQLGRYGIVRNHSYKLTINKVLNPGKPITGDKITPEDKPDDDTPDYYMDVTINVLSWAVRNQGVDL